MGVTKSNTMDVPSLLENAEYFFRVAAENEEGLGPFAEMAEAIVPIKEPGISFRKYRNKIYKCVFFLFLLASTHF